MKKIFLGVLVCSALPLYLAEAKVTYEQALTDEAAATAESQRQYQTRLNDPNNYRPLEPAHESGKSRAIVSGTWVPNGTELKFRTSNLPNTVNTGSYSLYAQVSQLVQSLPSDCIRGDKVGLYSHKHHYDSVYRVYECK